MQLTQREYLSPYSVSCSSHPVRLLGSAPMNMLAWIQVAWCHTGWPGGGLGPSLSDPSQSHISLELIQPLVHFAQNCLVPPSPALCKLQRQVPSAPQRLDSPRPCAGSANFQGGANVLCTFTINLGWCRGHAPARHSLWIHR